MARPSNSAERREQIVDGLLEVMAESGFEGASIGAIAKAAGVTPGLVHYHFEDKRELLHAAIDRLRDRALTRLSQAGRGGAPTLRDLVRAMTTRGPTSSPVDVACWVAVGAEAVREVKTRRRFEAAMREVAVLLEARAREDGLPPEHAARAAWSLVALVQGFFLLSAAAPGALPAGLAEGAGMALVSGLHEEFGP